MVHIEDWYVVEPWRAASGNDTQPSGAESSDAVSVSSEGAAIYQPSRTRLSRRLLKQRAGQDDLDNVTFLELCLEPPSAAARHDAGCIGNHLPNLTMLKLSDSASIPCLRDLGVCLTRLRVLWLCRVGLQDLTGATALPALEELYVASNLIDDLAPLCCNMALRVLDVERNMLSEIRDIEILGSCTTLRELTIAGNPICELSAFSRQLVHEILPQVETLDDTRFEVPAMCLDRVANNCETVEWQENRELQSAIPLDLVSCHAGVDAFGLGAAALAEADDLLAEVEDAAALAALRDFARLEEENAAEGQAICQLRERWRQAQDEDGSTEAIQKLRQRASPRAAACRKVAEAPNR